MPIHKSLFPRNIPHIIFAQAMATRLSSSFRLSDLFRLGGAMPEEALEDEFDGMWSGKFQNQGLLEEHIRNLEGITWI